MPKNTTLEQQVTRNTELLEEVLRVQKQARLLSAIRLTITVLLIILPLVGAVVAIPRIIDAIEPFTQGVQPFQEYPQPQL